MKHLITILALAAFTTLNVRAEDQKFEGTMSCAKCALHTASECADVLKVGDVTYELEEKGSVKTSAHKCSGTTAASVTGKVEDRAGKKFIVVTTISQK